MDLLGEHRQLKRVTRMRDTCWCACWVQHQLWHRLAEAANLTLLAPVEDKRFAQHVSSMFICIHLVWTQKSRAKASHGAERRLAWLALWWCWEYNIQSAVRRAANSAAPPNPFPRRIVNVLSVRYKVCAKCEFGL